MGLVQTPSTTIKNGSDLDFRKLKSDLEALDVKADVLIDLNGIQSFVKEGSKDKNIILFLSNSSLKGFWSSDFAKNIH